MKKVKLILSTFIFLMIISVSVASAANPPETVGISVKLGGNSAVYNTKPQTKLYEGMQYMQTTGSTDTLTGKNRAVSAMLNGSDRTGWLNVTYDNENYVSWKEEFTKKTGAYYVSLKATTKTLAGVYYSGMWFLSK